MSTYSFQDIVAAITGPGGAFPLATGAGASEEGITIEPSQDKNVMTIGAGGEGMHSLVADESSTVTVRLLKTSPVNAALSQMYNIQTRLSATHGKNTITVSDIARGDLIVLSEVAFAKPPPINYAKEGGIMEWTFHAIRTSRILGIGTPSL